MEYYPGLTKNWYSDGYTTPGISVCSADSDCE